MRLNYILERAEIASESPQNTLKTTTENSVELCHNTGVKKYGIYTGLLTMLLIKITPVFRKLDMKRNTKTSY